MLLIDGKTQVEELKLSIVAIEHVPAGGALLAGTAYILPQAVEGGALLRIALRVVAVGIPDVFLERRHPVNLVGGL